MAQGIKLEDTVSKQKVIDTLYECDGMLHYAAKSLFISRNALNEYIERNDLWAEVKKARDQHKDVMVDIGLYGTKKLAEQLEAEPSVALKACIDALNRYGKERGVSMSNDETNKLQSKLEFYEKILQNVIGNAPLPKA